MIRVLIAEDHAMMREGLRQIIDCSEGMTTVGTAASGIELIEKLANIEIDLLITDMSMPGVGGVDLIRRVRKAKPELPILVMSMHDTGKIVSAAVSAGANGYITKNADPDKFPAIIRTIANGGTYIEPIIANLMVFDRAAQREPHELLTEREAQVLHMIISGKLTKQMAHELFISPKTVSTHKKQIMKKMGIANTADLVRYAMAHNLNGLAAPSYDN